MKAGPVYFELGWDIRIEIFPEARWTPAKMFFFEALAAIIAADLTRDQQNTAFVRLVEGLNNEYDHDEGGWLALHTRESEECQNRHRSRAALS